RRLPQRQSVVGAVALGPEAAAALGAFVNRVEVEKGARRQQDRVDLLRQRIAFANDADIVVQFQGARALVDAAAVRLDLDLAGLLIGFGRSGEVAGIDAAEVEDLLAARRADGNGLLALEEQGDFLDFGAGLGILAEVLE